MFVISITKMIMIGITVLKIYYFNCVIVIYYFFYQTLCSIISDCSFVVLILLINPRTTKLFTVTN